MRVHTSKIDSRALPGETEAKMSAQNTPGGIRQTTSKQSLQKRMDPPTVYSCTCFSIIREIFYKEKPNLTQSLLIYPTP
jgi:hypothetical protein